MNLAFPSSLRSALAALAVVTSFAAVAQDKPGSSDSPLISRYRGSHLIFQSTDSFVHVDFPTSYDLDSNNKLTKLVPIEGARERRVYLAPPGHTALEIQHAYVNALATAGAKHLLTCNQGQPCDFAAMQIKQVARAELSQQNDYAWRPFDHMDPSFHASGELERGGRTQYVTVMTTGDENGVATLIDIVTPKAADTGGVKVADANAIAQSLNAEGKMAIYGVTFDTGKADIRPDSKPQLAEMAKILKSNAQLKVFIVGHTDNQGDYKSNLVLSQRRAEAIVATLARDYAVAAARMTPLGVANAAPVASNATEEGRARNRRVEMVVQ